jgi:hypothetical protein
MFKCLKKFKLFFHTDTLLNDDEIEMKSTLENLILESEPKTELDVVVKEEKKIIKKSISTNGMYCVVIFFTDSIVFCQSSRLYLTGSLRCFFKFEAGVDSEYFTVALARILLSVE